MNNAPALNISKKMAASGVIHRLLDGTEDADLIDRAVAVLPGTMTAILLDHKPEEAREMLSTALKAAREVQPYTHRGRQRAKRARNAQGRNQ